MPRLNADLIINVREKNQRKAKKIEIFHCDEKKIRVKINGKWFKNKAKFCHKKFESLFYKTIENKLYKE